MTKREYIKEKWETAGFIWDEINSIVNENGLLKLEDRDGGNITGYTKAYNNGLTKGLGYNFDHKFIVELDALENVNQNNGWTKIETSADLPKEPGFYTIIRKTDNTAHDRFLSKSSIDRKYGLKHYTHWRKTNPKPLY